jgi:hypothetical protein
MMMMLQQKNYSYKESSTTNYLHSISFIHSLSTFIQLMMMMMMIVLMMIIIIMIMDNDDNGDDGSDTDDEIYLMHQFTPEILCTCKL